MDTQYEAVAAILADVERRARDGDIYDDDALPEVRSRLADLFATNDARFDREQFTAAATYEPETYRH